MKKKDKIQNNTKLLRQMIDGDIVDNNGDDLIDNPLTSSLEKKRRRIVNEFEQ